MKCLAVCLGGLLAVSLAVVPNSASAGDYRGGTSYSGSSGSSYSSGSSTSGSSGYASSGYSHGCGNCPPPRKYDSQEVVKTTKDVDHSRVIESQSVVPSKRLIETNHLIIRENETRNVGTVQHNHTIIEKELVLRKNNVDTKHVNTTVNLVEHKYNTERKRVVEEREIPGENRTLTDCNCDNKYSRGNAVSSYGSGGTRYSNSRY